MMPITTAAQGSTTEHDAVIETNPAKTPLHISETDIVWSVRKKWIARFDRLMCGRVRGSCGDRC